MGFTVGIVGASGAVGQELLNVLERRVAAKSFPAVDRVLLFGSSRSAGTEVESAGFGTLLIEEFEVMSVRKLCDVIFLAVSGSFALEHAKTLCEGPEGAVVIDNSSAFRYDDEIPLVVPEINGSTALTQENFKLIANPNCTTAIGVMAIAPLAKRFGIKRLLMSTYQAASGAGQPGMDELLAGTKSQLDTGVIPAAKTFVHPLPFNVIPHIDKFQANGYTKEEMKVVWETRKICGFNDPHNEVAISCSAVRIPTLRAHSEVIVLETIEEIDIGEARQILDDAPGIDLVDDPTQNLYPMPLTATGQDNVQVGRIREALAFGKHGLEFFVSGDQLLRGAALNAVLIAECLYGQGLLATPSKSS